MKTGHTQQAIPYLQRAIALKQNLHVAHEDLGILYAQDKQPEKAITEFRKAIRSDASNYDAHYRLARLYRQLGRTAEADKEFGIVHKLQQQKREEPLMKVSGPR